MTVQDIPAPAASPLSDRLPEPLSDPLPGTISATALRAVLGRFATGVTIITCRDAEGRAVGLTANSFTSLSLDPPLVLWSLRQASSSLAAFQAAEHFAINVLAETQVDLSRRFAAATTDKFADGVWVDGHGGAPVLGGCAAVFECRTETRQIAGDHVLFIGHVLRLADLAVAPLLFQGGHYRMLGEIL